MQKLGSVAGLGLVMMTLFAEACSAPSDTEQTWGNNGSGATGGNGGNGGNGGTGPGTCVPGGNCSCSSSRAGVVECIDGNAVCQCEECPPLETTDPVAVVPCVGEATGTWLSTDMKLGKGALTVSRAGQVVGSCDAEIALKSTSVPRVLMDLEAGGTSRHHSVALNTTNTWSDGCVTALAPELACEEPVWDAYSCSLDCDICLCNGLTPEFVTEYGSWQRTEQKLTLTLWDKAGAAYDYCATGDALSISVPGIFMSFKRVYLFSKPQACADRSPDVCVTGTGCKQGVCVGDAAGCASQVTEGTCLTVSGCSWDATQCSGAAQGSCAIEDYGVVPGCDVLDKPLLCVGDRKPCADRDQTACAEDEACTLSSSQSCTGGAINCEEFTACPDAECDLVNSTCTGTTSCESEEGEENCTNLNRILPTPRCTWETKYTCSGTVKQCSEIPPEQCAEYPECRLESAP